MVHTHTHGRLFRVAGMEETLQAEGPWTLLAPTDATLDDAGFNVRTALETSTDRSICQSIRGMVTAITTDLLLTHTRILHPCS